jgi:hypothetical protein
MAKRFKRSGHLLANTCLNLTPGIVHLWTFLAELMAGSMVTRSERDGSGRCWCQEAALPGELDVPVHDAALLVAAFTQAPAPLHPGGGVGGQGGATRLHR